ncbi:transcriptional regulator [Lentzea sp. NBRC 105346]|uniref:helix-turn-helix domain-containing protein n=1 Tax=Lentzea sp. NBRC 105346 TaxID=3032205 RepID=UPI0024A53A36|nr:helix-turn-helix transcriptional regulator [Lentzea sp. NBRC 105346]GLZ34227.1 transcriptional regulator [Lentzea sp. NBRC 105346]
MSIQPDEQRQRREGLAAALRQLRKAAGLSGERLAVRCAMSQSKISRIERGKILPSVADVERILRALQVPADAARELVAVARAANIDYVSYRAYASMGLWKMQDEIKALIESSAVVKQFLPAMPTGLLQLPEYMRLAFSPVAKSAPVIDVEKAVQARLDSQRVLGDESKRFVFLMTEQAVRWRYVDQRVMARQVAHMAEVSTRANIDIAILPFSAEVRRGPLNIFFIYDDRLVVAELFSGAVSLREPQDVQYHLELFDFFYDHALTGDDATAFLWEVAEEFMQSRD